MSVTPQIRQIFSARVHELFLNEKSKGCQQIYFSWNWSKHVTGSVPGTEAMTTGDAFNIGFTFRFDLQIICHQVGHISLLTARFLDFEVFTCMSIITETDVPFIIFERATANSLTRKSHVEPNEMIVTCQLHHSIQQSVMKLELLHG